MTRFRENLIAIAILCIATVAVTTQSVHAHNLPDCVHVHTIGIKKFHTCTPNNVACAVTVANTCKTQRSSIVQAASWCRCVPPPNNDCFAAFAHAFITSGPPAAFDTKLFSAEPNEQNETTLFYGENVLIDHFGPGDIGFGGTFLLDFGSFQDPRNVTVEIQDATLTFPSISFAGVETGTHIAVLSPGAPQFLVYDSTTGVLNTMGDGILFDITSTMTKFASIPVFLEGEIDLLDDDATTLISGQFSTPVPDSVVFLDNFEFGDTRAWSTTIGSRASESSTGSGSLKYVPFASMAVIGLGAWARRRRRSSQPAP